jgi:hypothetical protein
VKECIGQIAIAELYAVTGFRSGERHQAGPRVFDSFGERLVT